MSTSATSDAQPPPPRRPSHVPTSAVMVPPNDAAITRSTTSDATTHTRTHTRTRCQSGQGHRYRSTSEPRTCSRILSDRRRRRCCHRRRSSRRRAGHPEYSRPVTHTHTPPRHQEEAADAEAEAEISCASRCARSIPRGAAPGNHRGLKAGLRFTEPCIARPVSRRKSSSSTTQATELLLLLPLCLSAARRSLPPRLSRASLALSLLCCLDCSCLRIRADGGNGCGIRAEGGNTERILSR